MLKKRTPLLVGLLVIVGVAAFMITFGSLEEGVQLEDAYEVYAIFDDATGLAENSRVMMSGIPVGQIRSIALWEQDPSRAKIVLAIDKRIELHEGVYDPDKGRWVNGAVASRLQASLLGDYYIGLAPGVAGERLGDGDQIKNVISESGINKVMDTIDQATTDIFPKLEKITSDIQAITGSLRETFGGEEGAAALMEIRDNVNTTSREVAALTSEVRGFLNERVISRGQDVEAIIGNVAAATDDLRAVSGQLEARSGDIVANVDGITRDLRRFLDEHVSEGASEREGTVAHALKKVDKSVAVLEGTLESAREVVGKVEAGEGTIGRLLTDDTLVRDVEGVVDDVKDITGPIGRLQVKVGFRTEYQVGQAALKNYVNFSLYPKPDKFLFFQIVTDPQGLVSTRERVTTTNDPDLPPVLVEEEVLTENKLKFTAMFGKRWHFITARYGLLESTGGLGLDLHLLEDALRFKVDLFDFSRDDWPRLRMLAAWEFARHLYVAAGIDDVLNLEGRDYFVGLGISFTDDDLKGLLPFLPTP
ncbi:MAG: MlaD family protein [Myxococcota bacterium]